MLYDISISISIHTHTHTHTHSLTHSLTHPLTLPLSHTEDQLWEHYPLFHINQPNTGRVQCSVCRRHVDNFAVHLHNDHGPPARGDPAHPREHAEEIALHAFSLVVCQHPDGRFLLVQEFANQGFWLPGGAVDAGESWSSAAVRETREEAGIDIELLGILKIECSSRQVCVCVCVYVCMCVCVCVYIYI